MKGYLRKFALSALISAAAIPAHAQDIYLARIRVDPAGKAIVEAPVNVTSRPGYDNQPSFSTDALTVFYTSTREDQQADIYSYNSETRAVMRLTKTAPESEYSAALMPDGKRFSVIRVEKDSSQRLWSFALDGSDPQVVVPNIKPVGYHSWVGTAHIAMFVLGSPNTLQLLDTRTSRLDTITTAIGRSLVAIPGPGAVAMVPRPDGGFSFVKREGATFTLYRCSTSESPVVPRVVTTLPEGSEYVAWMSSTRLVTGQGSKLLVYDTMAGGSWTELADLTTSGVTRISRIAVGTSAHGQWIAIVAEPSSY